MKYGSQQQDEDFMERISRGGKTPNGVNFKTMRGVGYYIYRGVFDEAKALKVVFCDKKNRWEVFDPEDEDPNIPVCTNQNLQPCVHYCISVL